MFRFFKCIRDIETNNENTAAFDAVVNSSFVIITGVLLPTPPREGVFLGSGNLEDVIAVRTPSAERWSINGLLGELDAMVKMCSLDFAELHMGAFSVGANDARYGE
ncbi:hypothetical protein CONPUDRAFT_156759 [Coniophora puteana RWD-64-598 SS2]|uniref:Uncharacterized protein n=1 Tax=Coniophora puteana (strain RWD-64-598) TaxID=741705 RepID=A0A5M3ME84_CONPW|nr:uncharacterized protein CONPUDRAFT_156759 [Coniophora puteana RWD-64-598 SS2]EIW77538.1 hypothetical protein CONPUDRAFT_156759 [Coniophora puteana RWD-64-598 SS2]